ncbi:hypothetical protein [Roseiflexus castenholzii]|uniref:hypothetical protein n=1 Tax=Roseiflexus castenholzii TaxID=120962 RepID=UPI003C798AA3
MSWDIIIVGLCLGGAIMIWVQRWVWIARIQTDPDRDDVGIRLPPSIHHQRTTSTTSEFGVDVLTSIAALRIPITVSIVAKSGFPSQMRVFIPKTRNDALRREHIGRLIEGELPGGEVVAAPSIWRDDALNPWTAIALVRGQSWWRPIGDDPGRDRISAIMASLNPASSGARAALLMHLCPTSPWKSRWRRWRIRRMLLRRRKDLHHRVVAHLESILHSPQYDALIAVMASAPTRTEAIALCDQTTAVLEMVTNADTPGCQRLRPWRTMTCSRPQGRGMWGGGAALSLGPILGAACAGFIIAALGWEGGWMFGAAALIAGLIGGRRAVDFLAGVHEGIHRWGEPIVRPITLSAYEAAMIWNTPPPRAGNVSRRKNMYLPPPEDAFAPPPEAAAQTHWVALALGKRSDGSESPVGTTLRDLRQVLHFTAGMGAGKSRLLANMIYQITRMPDVGLGIIDGKGDDSGALGWLSTLLVPMEREDDIIILDPLNLHAPIAINPLQSPDGDSSTCANQFLAMMARLDPSTWKRSHGMEQYALHAGILVAESEERPTVIHIKQALLDEAYRKRLLAKARNIETILFWSEVHPQIGSAQRSSLEALVRRIDKVLVPETVRWIFTSPEPTVSILEAMENRRILIVPLPTERLGGIAYAIATLLVREIVLSAFLRGGSDRERSEWPLIIDEIQVLVNETGGNDDFRTMLSRLRSLGIPGIYTHQTLAQLGTLVDDMLVNAANRVILRTPPPDADVYAKRYAAVGLTSSDISEQQPNEHQYVCLMRNGAAIGPFSARPLPWPAPALPIFPPWTGESWRTKRAPATTPLEQEIDDQVEMLMQWQEAWEQGKVNDVMQRCQSFAEITPEAKWAAIRERWVAHRLHQRAWLLQTPEAIPDHLERRRTISALCYGRPTVEAMISYFRIRRGKPSTAEASARHSRRTSTPSYDANMAFGVEPGA